MSGKKDNTGLILGVILGIFVFAIIVFLLYYYRDQIFSSNVKLSTTTPATESTTTPATESTTTPATGSTTTPVTGSTTTPATGSTTTPVTGSTTTPVIATPSYIKNRLYSFGKYNPNALTNGINLSRADGLTDEENKLFENIDISTERGTLSDCSTKCSSNTDCSSFVRSNTVNDNDIAECYLKKVPSFKNSDGTGVIISNRTGTPYNTWIKTYSPNNPIKLKNANGEIVTISNNSDTSNTNKKFYVKNPKYGFGMFVSGQYNANNTPSINSILGTNPVVDDNNFVNYRLAQFYEHSNKKPMILSENKWVEAPTPNLCPADQQVIYISKARYGTSDVTTGEDTGYWDNEADGLLVNRVKLNNDVITSGNSAVNKDNATISNIFKNDILGKNNFDSRDFRTIKKDNTDPAPGTYKTFQMWYKCGKRDYTNGLGVNNTRFSDVDISTFTGAVEQCKKKCSETTNCNGFTRPNTVSDDIEATCYLKKIPINDNGSFISNQTDYPYNSWIGANMYPINITDENGTLQTIY